jgi:hypothetical protein
MIVNHISKEEGRRIKDIYHLFYCTRFAHEPFIQLGEVSQSAKEMSNVLSTGSFKGLLNVDCQFYKAVDG